MKKQTLVTILSFFIISVMAVESQAVTKVARKLNFLSFYAGSSQIHGEYTGLPFLKFNAGGEEIVVDGDEIYDDGFHLGVQYGNLIGKNLSVAIGFRYTRHNLKDTIYVLRDVPFGGDVIDFFYTFDGYELTLSQYDFETDFNYMLTDPVTNIFSPYIGLGLKAGLSNGDFPGFEAENDFTVSLNFNFGADLKVWQSNDKTDFITLSSVNSYDIFSNDNKARYLNIGGALKYYFRQ